MEKNKNYKDIIDHIDEYSKSIDRKVIKTLNLSTSVIKELEKISSEKNISISETANEILKFCLDIK